MHSNEETCPWMLAIAYMKLLLLLPCAFGQSDEGSIYHLIQINSKQSNNNKQIHKYVTQLQIVFIVGYSIQWNQGNSELINSSPNCRIVSSLYRKNFRFEINKRNYMNHTEVDWNELHNNCNVWICIPKNSFLLFIIKYYNLIINCNKHPFPHIQGVLSQKFWKAKLWNPLSDSDDIGIVGKILISRFRSSPQSRV